MHWRKFNGDAIKIPIKKAVEQPNQFETEQGNKLKVCIGNSSQVCGDDTDFATVIGLLLEKRGEFMFINNERSTIKYSIKERMLEEVSKSILIAYSLCDLLDQYDV